MQVRPLVASAVLALSFAAVPVALMAQEDQEVEGELLEVNQQARTLVIKPAKGETDVLVSKWQFSYDDQTKVTGAEEGVAGLAMMVGVLVTVHFVIRDDVALATRIEVHAKT